MTDQSNTQHTPGPWKFARMDSAVEFAALKGETLEEHEGYFRTNGGDWIVTFGGLSDDEYAGPIAHAIFRGQAKRGQAYNAPDPEGQANARLIAASPWLFDAASDTVLVLKLLRQGLAKDPTVIEAIDSHLDLLETALNLARGEA